MPPGLVVRGATEEAAPLPELRFRRRRAASASERHARVRPLPCCSVNRTPWPRAGRRRRGRRRSS